MGAPTWKKAEGVTSNSSPHTLSVMRGTPSAAPPLVTPGSASGTISAPAAGTLEQPSFLHHAAHASGMACARAASASASPSLTSSASSSASLPSSLAPAGDTCITAISCVHTTPPEASTGAWPCASRTIRSRHTL